MRFSINFGWIIGWCCHPLLEDSRPTPALAFGFHFNVSEGSVFLWSKAPCSFCTFVTLVFWNRLLKDYFQVTVWSVLPFKYNQCIRNTHKYFFFTNTSRNVSIIRYRVTLVTNLLLDFVSIHWILWILWKSPKTDGPETDQDGDNITSPEFPTTK